MIDNFDYGLLKEHRFLFSLPLVVAFLATIVLTGGSFEQKAYAVGGTVDSTSCGPTFGGVWDGVDKCTITTGITINNGETLTIPSGTELVVANIGDFTTGISNSGTIDNSGTLTVSNTGDFSTGISNSGNLTSSGTLTVSNSGVAPTGISNSGTIDNSGTLTVSNSSGANAGISNSGTIDNSGTLTVSNSGSTGIRNNGGNLTSSGTLTVSNTAGVGIDSSGTLTNSGTITVSNTDGTGIFLDFGTLTNSGTITVSNTDGTGILNDSGATITNSGTITISNTVDSLGIHNDGGTITSSGTIDVSNSGSTGSLIGDNSIGIFNDGGTITNSGEIIVNNSCDIPPEDCDGSGISNGGTFTNLGTVTITNGTPSTKGISNFSSGSIFNSGTITIANSNGRGITSSALIQNSGTIEVSNSGGSSSGIQINDPSGALFNTNIININVGSSILAGDFVSNGDAGVINIYGLLNISTEGSVDNDGAITIFSGGEIDNGGAIENTFGEIVKKCGGTYNGAAPTGNPVVNEVCDAIPPDTQITGAFDGKGVPLKSTPKKPVPITTSTSVKFFFIGSDNQGVVSFECNLDGAGWTTCTSGVTYTGLQAALTHVFQVRSIDTSGNTDSTPATFTWKINPPKLK